MFSFFSKITNAPVTHYLRETNNGIPVSRDQATALHSLLAHHKQHPERALKAVRRTKNRGGFTLEALVPLNDMSYELIGAALFSGINPHRDSELSIIPGMNEQIVHIVRWNNQIPNSRVIVASVSFDPSFGAPGTIHYQSIDDSNDPAVQEFARNVARTYELTTPQPKGVTTNESHPIVH